MSKQMVLFGVGIVLAVTSLGASIAYNIEVKKDFKLRAFRIENVKTSYEIFDRYITEWNVHVKDEDKIPNKRVSKFRRAAFRAMRTGTSRDFERYIKSMNNISKWQKFNI